MEKDLNHQGRQGEDRGDGIRRRPKEERQQTARRRPVGESETQAGLTASSGFRVRYAGSTPPSGGRE